jgi:hypothetical protein
MIIVPLFPDDPAYAPRRYVQGTQGGLKFHILGVGIIRGEPR